MSANYRCNASRGYTDRFSKPADWMCGIMSLTDAKYGKFVDNLDNSQAILLRASGGAVVPVVQALAGGGALQQRPLKLENTTVNDKLYFIRFNSY